MVKYRGNENWRERNRAYREMPDARLKTYFVFLCTIEKALRLLPKRGKGKHPKVTPAKAAFLAAIRQYHSLPYRALPASGYTKWLGLEGVHYTSIYRAIKRLPEGFQKEAMRILAAMRCGYLRR